MASIFDRIITYGGHATCESTLMGATFASMHFYNMIADVDIDNGAPMLLKPENYQESDLFKAEVPAITDKIVLALTAPKIYQEFMERDQEEANFFNGKGEAIRAYEVFETDRFTLDALGFDDDATPEVGKYVVVNGTDYKFTTVDDEPAANTYGFVGYIYTMSNNGKYRIFVKRNRAVE